MRINSLNKDVFKQSFKVFVDYFFGAWLISGAGLSTMCFWRCNNFVTINFFKFPLFVHLIVLIVLRKIFGRFYYSTVLALPGFTGALISQFFLADRAVYAYAHGLSTIVTELLCFTIPVIVTQSKSINRNFFSTFQLIGPSNINKSWWFLFFENHTEFPICHYFSIYGFKYAFNAWIERKWGRPLLLVNTSTKT